MPKKELCQDEIIEFLNQEKVGRLGTCDAQNRPYIVSVNYVYKDGKIYFHCANKGKKLDHIARNPHVCFEVSSVDKQVFDENVCQSTTRYHSVQVFGEAKVLLEKEEKQQALIALVEKFAQGRSFQPMLASAMDGITVVEIVIDEIHGKKNVDPETDSF